MDEIVQLITYGHLKEKNQTFKVSKKMYEKKWLNVFNPSLYKVLDSKFSYDHYAMILMNSEPFREFRLKFS